MLALALALALGAGGPFAEALRPGQRAAVDKAVGGLDALPLYELELTADPPGRVFHARERIHWKNPLHEPVGEVTLRLFANADSVRVRVTGARVEGQGARYELLAPTLALVHLDAPLQPGAALVLELSVEGDIPELPPDDPLDTGMSQGLAFAAGGAPAGGSDYGTYGTSQGVTSLGDWHPVLAARRGDGFDREPPTAIGDQAEADPANYALTVVAPPEYVVAAPGLQIGRVPGPDRRVRWSFAVAAARSAPVFLSKRFESGERKVGDVTVRGYWLKGDAAPGKKALEWAAKSLAAFDARFGPYPWSTFALVEAPLRAGAGGAEYCGLATATSAFYRPGKLPLSGASVRDGLEFIVAHEVAHQWWAGVVGSDVRAHPQVDESLAQYSALLYWEKAHGAKAAARVAKTQVRVNWAGYRLLGGEDGAVDRSTGDYGSSIEYAGLVYGKAPFYFAAVRKLVGDAAFDKALQTYYLDYAFKDASPRAFTLEAMAQKPALEKRLDALYVRWMEGKHGDEDLPVDKDQLVRDVIGQTNPNALPPGMGPSPTFDPAMMRQALEQLERALQGESP